MDVKKLIKRIVIGFIGAVALFYLYLLVTAYM